MEMELKRGKKVRYNDLERAYFKAIPQDGTKINLKKLIYTRLQFNPEWDVIHPRNVISTQMIRLARKIERNEEPFVLKREGFKRHQVWYWLEPLKQRPRSTSRSTRAGSTRIALFD